MVSPTKLEIPSVHIWICLGSRLHHFGTTETFWALILGCHDRYTRPHLFSVADGDFLRPCYWQCVCQLCASPLEDI
uniref:Uncharacterized protein n=1 Tax=Lepeophtheirus salmonis TaxID=72036 RepID=A0A0K2VJI0_LEPSM